MILRGVQAGNSRCPLVTFNLGFCDHGSGVDSAHSISQFLPSLSVSKTFEIFWQVCVCGGVNKTDSSVLENRHHLTLENEAGGQHILNSPIPAGQLAEPRKIREPGSWEGGFFS